MIARSPVLVRIALSLVVLSSAAVLSSAPGSSPVAVGLGPAPALAQNAPPDARATARQHFDRGIELFNEGRLDAALAELSRAYELAPAFPVLYNLARVHAELSHPVEAARLYQRYLEEGGAQVPEARRTEVEAALARQRDRIGTLVVVTPVDGSVVSLDGVDVGTTPLAAPIELGVGAHTVGVRAPGHESVVRAISIAARTEARIEVELRREVEQRGTLRITTTVPAVTISIDGATVGITPLEGTIPIAPGDHDIRAERPGYVTDARRVHVEDGGEYDVRFVMETDPEPHPSSVGTLTLRLPDAAYRLRIDGQERSARDALRLPIGPHLLEIEAEDREPWTGEASVESGRMLELAPRLSWTVDARAERRGDAGATRIAGITITAVGAAMLAGGLAVVGWNEAEIASTDAQGRMLFEQYTALGCPAALGCERLRDDLDAVTASQERQNVIRIASITGATLGAALMTLGVILWVSAPTDAAIESSAHATLSIGPGGLFVRGTF